MRYRKISNDLFEILPDSVGIKRVLEEMAGVVDGYAQWQTLQHLRVQKRGKICFRHQKI